MPELPDIAILADAFQAAFVGRTVLGTEARETLVVRGTPAELTALGSQVVERIERRGKFIVIDLTTDRIIVNAMLTGRLGLAPSGTKALTSTAWTVRLGPRVDRPTDVADWTRNAAWLPGDGDEVELRYRDPTRMGKIYLLPAGSDRPVAGWDALGPDADDPTLDLATWRQRIGRHRGELKNLLKEQQFVAGIGNGYSDEILWAAELAPFRKRSTLADEEIDRLYMATRSTLAWAIAELRQRVPPRFEVEVRDFLRVHRKGGSPCPRCGTTISEIAPGGFVTSYCRGCQR
ncbi:MAG TPA: DNA-formamidopyrimidine glycosylase family protein [Candidatus Limnocylindrales bacterium]